VASIYDTLGISRSELKTTDPSNDVNQVLQDWANDLIKELRTSLQTEVSSGTSKALEQSMKIVPPKGDTIEVAISMLDYYDYTNKGVEGIGGNDKGKHPTFGQYRFNDAPIKIDNSLRQWANVKGLSEYALAYSIAQRGIEGKQWFDKVVTQEAISDLSLRVAKVLGRQAAIGISKTLESGN